MKYRIVERLVDYGYPCNCSPNIGCFNEFLEDSDIVVSVQVHKWYGWVTIKEFVSDDIDYSRMCAEELYEMITNN